MPAALHKPTEVGIRLEFLTHHWKNRLLKPTGTAKVQAEQSRPLGGRTIEQMLREEFQEDLVCICCCSRRFFPSPILLLLSPSLQARSDCVNVCVRGRVRGYVRGCVKVRVRGCGNVRWRGLRRYLFEKRVNGHARVPAKGMDCSRDSFRSGYVEGSRSSQPS
jgi:hypothetical protein